jgi:hypothetical protein
MRLLRLWVVTVAVSASTALCPPAAAQTGAGAGKPTASPSENRKALALRVVQLQQQGLEGLARMLVERPAMQMLQAASQAAHAQLPEQKREAAIKAIRADIQKFADEMNPLARERALKLAPTTIGPMLESKFTEEELRQLVSWLESPVSKKFQSVSAEIQDAFAQKLVAEVSKSIDPKLKQLEGKVRTHLGVGPANAQGTPPARANPTPSSSAAEKPAR